MRSYMSVDRGDIIPIFIPRKTYQIDQLQFIYEKVEGYYIKGICTEPGTLTKWPGEFTIGKSYYNNFKLVEESPVQPEQVEHWLVVIDMSVNPYNIFNVYEYPLMPNAEELAECDAKYLVKRGKHAVVFKSCYEMTYQPEQFIKKDHS